MPNPAHEIIVAAEREHPHGVARDRHPQHARRVKHPTKGRHSRPQDIRKYNFWVTVKPSTEARGEWVAHCLDVDVVTQGRSVVHAFEMAAEAVSMVLEDDLSRGVDPTSRRAPEEFWDGLYQLLAAGVMVPFAEAAAPTPGRSIAAQLVVQVALVARSTPQPATKRESVPSWEVPALWTKARDRAVHA